MEKTDRLLTYGLFNNNLKHISEVENGLACKCICANCKHPLVAKNNLGNKKTPHFAHHSGKECEGAIETTLHLLAKSILQKTKQLMLPKYHHDYDQFNNKSIFRESKQITFDNIILEKIINSDGFKIIPDAIGQIKNKEILIEFANTHFVEQNKMENIKKLGISCIEIDLSEQPLEEKSLTDFLNSDTKFKYWIINHKLDQEYADDKIRLLKQKKQNRQQKIIEEYKRDEDSFSKYKYYDNKKDYKIIKLINEEIYNCPLKSQALEKLKSTKFYQHEFLKKIIDGEYWNKIIYGYPPNGKWIFLKHEKIIIYPPDEKLEKLSNQENKINQLFFSGLQNLKKLLSDSNIGNCSNCKFSVDNFSIQNNDYKVCKYPNE